MHKLPFRRLGQDLAHQRDGKRPLSGEGYAIQPIEHLVEAGEIAWQAREKVVDHFVGELEPALAGRRLQLRALVGVR